MYYYKEILFYGFLIWLVFIGLIFEPFYEWGIQVAARNDCKSIKCLVDKWYLFEADCGVPQLVLDRMIKSKHWAEYAKTTKDCNNPSELYGWDGKRKS